MDRLADQSVTFTAACGKSGDTIRPLGDHMHRVVMALVIVGGVAVLHSQSPTSATPASFDVVSIKPVATPPERGGGGFLPGRFVVTNATLYTLVQTAHELKAYQLVNNGPSWITSEQFSVDAKAGATSTTPLMPVQMRPLLQRVLTERFKLRTHRESREMPIYNLVFARRDQRLGSQLRPSRIDCSTAEGRTQALSVMAEGRKPCGTIWTNGSFTADGVDFAQLTMVVLDRPVINRTGLRGSFDWELKWVPDPDLDGPALGTAFEEQLGLKLEPGRGPIEVLVIDSAERPTPN
jgi:uncharacterized protein (TIGR03435 family)